MSVNTNDGFDEVWREHGPTIWRAVYVYAGGRRDIADDAVAEAFARAMEQPNPIKSPVAYLYRLAFQAAAMERRRMTDLREPPDVAGLQPDGYGEDIMAALRRLSPGQRAAIYLHYRVDLPVAEVAAAMGTSAAVVKVHLMRGRRKLATYLSEEAADD
jgi:RNA polymerase sigma-70 factor (ECF subfamily)